MSADGHSDEFDAALAGEVGVLERQMALLKTTEGLASGMDTSATPRATKGKRKGKVKAN